MSSDIEVYQDGSGSFISARHNAWHLLGTVKPDGYLTLDDMLDGSRADYTVSKINIQGVDLTEAGIEVVDDHDVMMTVRRHPETGQLQKLGIVGKDYTIIQNRDAFAFGQYLLDSSAAIGETAGVLRGGKRAFAAFRIGDPIAVGGVDPIHPYLGIYTSHDGTVAYTAMNTMIRIVCQNTANLALAQAKHKWILRHTRHAVLDKEKARKALNLAADYRVSFAQAAEELIGKRVTAAKFEEIITREFGPGEDPTKKAQHAWDERYERLTGLFNDADTQENIRGTAWAAWNAIVEYGDWFVPVRGVPAGRVEQAQFARSLEGGVDKMKVAMQRALMAV